MSHVLKDPRSIPRGRYVAHGMYCTISISPDGRVFKIIFSQGDDNLIIKQEKVEKGWSITYRNTAGEELEVTLVPVT
jgi:hypothetical protein